MVDPVNQHQIITIKSWWRAPFRTDVVPICSVPELQDGPTGVAVATKAFNIEEAFWDGMERGSNAEAGRVWRKGSSG